MTMADRLLRRHRAYLQLFTDAKGQLSPVAEPVMRDLARFCCATLPTIRMRPDGGGIDPLAMAVAEGRREVFNRIQAMLNLTPQQIQRLSETQDD